MCGIVGTVSAPGGEPPKREVLARMCAALAHRGPDSRGLHCDERAGLGIQRLRVIDLVTGDQPVHSEDGAVSVVLNGEIYNYRELRAELRARGHVFATDGDSEVIVHLYEEEGVNCVARLHGMFAFAVWDARAGRLVLARDRVGKKPLFYALADGRLSFASELRALLQDPAVPRRIDPRAVDAFLAYGYVPAPLSIFDGVRKLAPAHTLSLAANGSARIERYWRLDYAHKLDVADPRELHEPLRDAILAATRRRLVADVPVGAFLSGGIDSSAVVAAMARESSGRVRTFAIGFDSERFNELGHARRVARLFDTEHHEFVVAPEAIDVAATMVRHYGEPFADSSAIPCFHLAELTRRHVTVALNGDGGDECFGGYTRYVANALAGRLDRLPAPLRRLVSADGHGVGDGNAASLANKLRRLRGGLALSPADRYRRYVSWLDDGQRARLYSDAFAATLGGADSAGFIGEAWAAASGDDVRDMMLEVDSGTYLPGDLLTKVDIATMAHALEARSPLLDHELMELAASIPAGLKVRGREKKWILREALRAWLPDDILDRPKQGFQVPLSDWFRGPLREHVREVLLDPGALDRDYFRPGEVQRLLDRHDHGADGVAKQLWALYTFELWHRQFVDAPAAPDRPETSDARQAPSLAAP